MLPQGDEQSPQLYQGQNVNGSTNMGNSSGGSCSNSNEQQHTSPSQSSGSGDDSPMDYLHPPMLPQEEELFSTYLHPPMALPDDSSNNHLHNAIHYDYSQFEHDSSMRVY